MNEELQARLKYVEEWDYACIYAFIDHKIKKSQGVIDSVISLFNSKDDAPFDLKEIEKLKG